MRKSVSPDPLVYKDAKLVPVPSPAPMATPASDEGVLWPELYEVFGDVLARERALHRSEGAAAAQRHRDELAQLRVELGNIREQLYAERQHRERARELDRIAQRVREQQTRMLRDEVRQLRSDFELLVTRTVQNQHIEQHDEVIREGVTVLRGAIESLRRY